MEKEIKEQKQEITDTKLTPENLVELISLIEKHEFLKCNLDYKTAECLEIDRKYALILSYHPLFYNSRHSVEVSIFLLFKYHFYFFLTYTDFT